MDAQFASAEQDIFAREKDVAERQAHMDAESAELSRMQDDLEAATERAKADMEHREGQVTLAQLESKAAGNLHSSLVHILEVQRKNAEEESTTTKELRKFEQEADVVLQASSLLSNSVGSAKPKCKRSEAHLRSLTAVFQAWREKKSGLCQAEISKQRKAS